MAAAELLGVYAEGWTNGDADKILKATSDNYTFDDPNSGRIPKKDFASYLEGLKQSIKISPRREFASYYSKLPQ